MFLRGDVRARLAVLAAIAGAWAFAVWGGPAFAAAGNPASTASGSDVRVSSVLGLPEPPVLESTTPVSPANFNLPLVRGRAELGTLVTLYASPDCSGPGVAVGPAEVFALTGIPVSVPDDRVTTISGTARSILGQVSSCSATPLRYAEDSAPPRTPQILSAPPASGDGTQVSWAFSADPGGTVTCTVLAQATVISQQEHCTSPVALSLEGRPDGEYRVEVRVTDLAGNTSAAAISGYLLLPAPIPPLLAAPPPDVPQASPSPAPPASSAAPTGPPAAVASASPSTARPTSPRPASPRPAGSSPGAPSAAGTPLALPPTGPSASSSVALAAASDHSSGTGANLVATVTRATLGNLDKTAFPTLLLVVMLGFLALQDRIDRRDPKLVLAPVNDQGELDFLPPDALGRTGTAAASAHPQGRGPRHG